MTYSESPIGLVHWLSYYLDNNLTKIFQEYNK